MQQPRASNPVVIVFAFPALASASPLLPCKWHSLLQYRAYLLVNCQVHKMICSACCTVASSLEPASMPLFSLKDRACEFLGSPATRVRQPRFSILEFQNVLKLCFSVTSILYSCAEYISSFHRASLSYPKPHWTHIPYHDSPAMLSHDRCGLTIHFVSEYILTNPDTNVPHNTVPEQALSYQSPATSVPSDTTATQR